MKRFAAVVLAVAVAGALALSATAREKKEKAEDQGGKASAAKGADKSYANGDYRFELKYDADWNAIENKMDAPKVDMGAMGKLPGMASMSLGMPRMLAVCFNGGKKCEMDEKDADPNARLMVVDLNSAPKGKARGGKGEAERHEEGKGGKDECEMIEKSSVKWGGASAPWMTMRCPEKKKWRYTTTVTMQRPNGKQKDLYTLMCSMRSESKDKEESMKEFTGELKPRCQKIVSTTKFGKK